ncbi:MAG: hypothetical protein N5P05_004496 (plasmid) [Chroococcopsis gigantea SAG 12.99]|jgi:hypothetical protein|nr:hypothetical protein [Chroococcopsis gigantea SAG 12.99]
MQPKLSIMLSVLTLAYGAAAMAVPVRNYSRNFNATNVEATGGRFPTLMVWPGTGLTLSLLNLKDEYVKQIWLDDPSKLTIDHAGNLCPGLPCPDGARVVHLKRITGLNFRNLPSTSLTTLTLVTVSPEGERIYKFLLGYGGGKPQYLVANLMPPVTPNLDRSTPLPPLTTLKTESRGTPVSSEKLALYETGLNRARGELNTSTNNRLVLTRIELFVEDLKAGYGEENARLRNNLSQNTLSRILSLGKESESGGSNPDT